jgi:hypothetical protein
MVLPVIITDPILKSAFVIRSLAYIEHPVLFRVAIVQELLDLNYKNKLIMYFNY